MIILDENGVHLRSIPCPHLQTREELNPHLSSENSSLRPTDGIKSYVVLPTFDLSHLVCHPVMHCFDIIRLQVSKVKPADVGISYASFKAFLALRSTRSL